MANLGACLGTELERNCWSLNGLKLSRREAAMVDLRMLKIAYQLRL